MKVTPALKKELAQWLDTYWTTYLNGDIETWATFIRDDYRNIGSTKEEIWNSKKEVIEYTTSILDQMIGSAEIRNREIDLIPFGEHMMVNEFTDLYVKIEGEWIFYGPFRISSLLEKTDSGWIALHQHGSYPDMKALEGEAFSIDAVKAENTKLLEAVKSRTIELEIEAALERVRAVAMGMKKPEDMLDVCRIISDQLQQFGVDQIRNVQTAIIDENIGQYLCYQYFPAYEQTTIEDTEYYKSPVEQEMVRQMLVSRDGHFIGSLLGEELEAFRSHRKEENHFHDPLLDEASEISYCFLSIGEGGLGLSLYQAMDEQVLTLFKRFHQVFSLAYQRFRDIQKAEAQAREAQIEVAVEKVRSKSMAMHHPDDFDKVNKEILTQLNWLQIQGLSGVTFYLVDQDGWVKAYDFSSPGNIGNQNSYTLQFDFKKYEMMGYPFKIFQQTDLNYFVADYPLEKLEKAVFEIEEINPEVATVVKEALAKGILTHQWTACARITDGVLGVDMISPPSEDTKTIVLKIAGAFNQAYTRFLDLQKAEAQARESQIEAALERVRSRSMAMHKSEELLDAGEIIFVEMQKLGIESLTAGLVLMDKEEKNGLNYAPDPSTHKMFPVPVIIPHDETKPMRQVVENWKKESPFFIVEMDEDETIQHQTFIAERSTNFPLTAAQLIAISPARLFLHNFYFKEGYVLIVGGTKLSGEQTEIMLRFAKVFQQTYTRFLDLQKAEAQAREAQIEAALERVRSRSLAMHHSSELSAVVDTLLREFTNLEFTLTFCIINLIDEQDMSNTVWAANPETGKDPESYYMKFEDYPFHHAMWDAWKAQKKRFVYTIEGKEKKIYDEYLYSETEFRRFPEHVKEANKALDRYVAGFTFFKYSGLQTVSLNPISEDELEILERFGKVFEQSYTRFLDLQKAESQAREAQIEAALEKVRSRSMAMHTSQELKEVALELRKQMGLLGQKDLETCAIHLYGNGEDSFESWSAMKAPGSDAEIVQSQAHFPKRGIRIIDEMMHHYTIGTKDYVLVNEGEKMAEWFKVLKKHAPELHASILDSLGKKPLKQLKGNWAVADFSGGALVMVTYGAPDEESRNLLRRSANVFEQAYVRFLDLQKAEGQAREAQIEVGLERVRARTMAMHSSDDVSIATATLFTELEKLGVQNLRGGIAIISPDQTQEVWSVNHLPEGITLRAIGIFDMRLHPFWQQLFKGFKTKEEFQYYWLAGKDKANYIALLNTTPHYLEQPITDFPDVHIQSYFFGEGAIWTNSLEPHSEGDQQIMKKFVSVFSLTFRRYLDLQKAEAQAKEAKIEASLERVRSKTMAMHNSQDVGDTVANMFDELVKLGIETNRCGILIFGKTHFAEVWTARSNPDGKATLITGQLDLSAHPLLTGFHKSWKKKDQFFTYELLGDDLIAYYQAINDTKYYPTSFNLETLPSREFHSDFYFAEGCIFAFTPEPIPSEGAIIFKRFAGVFGQTYRRFLDLQKAEAQARESQIQLAMERVRARTMAMHHSSELADTATILFQQIKELGFEIWSCGFGIWRPEVNMEEAWMSTGDLFPIILLPFKEDPSHLGIYEASQRGESVYEVEVKGEVLTRHYDWLMSQPSFKIVFGQIENSGSVLPTVQYKYAAFFKQGYLHLITTKPQPDVQNINQRFAKVFEQTYTRFLDLQKAEAQAREAEIELALERVRARTMAMHHTEELKEVIQVVFDQFVGLNIHVEHAGFILDYKEQEDMHIWLADHQQGVPTEITIPYFDSPHWNSYLEAKANQESFFANLLPFEAKNKFYKDLFEWIPELTEEAQQAIFGKHGLAISTVLLDNVGLYIEHYSETPFTAEENAILMRFGKVFQQTYTRFLDLQKAEAQARESQIQLALERVRARTMAMHKSQELAEVAVVLYQELKTLGATQDFFECGYVEVDEKNNIQRAWSTRPDGSLLKEPFYLPLTGEPVIDARYEAWKQRVPVCHQAVGGELLKRANEFVIPYMNNQEAAEITSSSAVPDPVHFYCGNFSHGYLNINCGEPLSAEEESLLARFTGVFEMTYQRFLDLQKAEAQAKDAQIELALERVRAKTMSIQKPDEFLDVISVIGEQFAHLGFDNEWVNFGANGLDISKGIDIWELVIMPGQYQSAQRVFIPFTEHILFRTLIEQFERYKKDGTNFFTLLLDKKELGKWLDYQYKETIYKEMPADVKALGYSKTSAVSSYIILKDTWFEVGRFSTNHFTDEENEIFKRFANAFGQAYTRFLDLQKAEAQARESQIQLALERVRARTMAMQKSDELPEAANLLFQQVQSLGMPAWSAGYCTWVDDKRTSVTLWMSSEGVLQPPFTAPTTEDELFIEMRKGQEDGKAFHVVEMGGDKLARHYQYMRTLPVVGNILDSIIEAGHPLPTFQIMHQAYFSKGFLLFITYEPVPESHDIFIRFAQVFEQTYTRFLDLQKAEAQAREAQIEVAVERVRAKALAMHRSEEILGVAVSIRDAMVALDLQGVSAATIYLEQDNGSVRVWDITELLESEKGPYLNLDFEFRLEETDSDLWFHRVWNFKEKYCVVEMDKDDLWRCEAWLRSFDPKNADNFLRFLESGQIKHLWLPTVSLESGKMNIDFVQPPPAEMEFILPKMAAAFDLAYKRFLDLQKAEAQAREAQIEAALERVRSRSMAMHKSEELKEVIQLLFDQFRLLNFKIDSAQFDPNYKENDDLNLWTAAPGQPYSILLNIPYVDSPLFNSIKEAKKRGLSFITQQLSFEDKNQFFRHFFQHIKNIPAERQKLIFDSPGMYRAVVFMENVSLAIQNYSNTPYTEEENEVLKRFGKTFEQVYTRFLDLQKAEAQAREAQIEAALEKVRGRTMAMHSSYELADAAYVLFEQLNFLGVTHERINIGIVNEDNHTIDFWVTEQGGDKLSTKFSGRISEPTTLSKAYDSWKKGEKSLVVDLIGEELKSWLHYLNEEIKIPFNKSYLHSRRVQTAGFFSKGMLILTSPEPLNEEALYLLEKFAGVFDLTYTRFNDLKIAEAQAREAQIEAALERVRSRTVGMQKSDELRDVIQVIYEQFIHLGIDLYGAAFAMDYRESEDWHIWSADLANLSPTLLHIPYFDHPYWNTWNDAKRKGLDTLAYTMAFEEKNSFVSEFGKHIPNLPAEALELVLSTPGYTVSNVFLKNVTLYIDRFTTEPYSDADNAILMRFGKVFEQTYTRFKDLEKAEAQAREAQIEAALERVRSRTMAMQRSEELPEVAGLLFQQVKALGVPQFHCGFNIFEIDDKECTWYPGSADGDILPPCKIPLTEHPVFMNFIESRKRGDELCVYEKEGEYQAGHYRYMLSLPVLGELLQNMLDAGIPFPTFQIDHLANFSHGNLLFITSEHFPEMHDTFKRFAKVFEQTYTRFLDLQKAEAQAREAQIENALEKVRSRSLAMHKSDELWEVVSVVFEKFQELKFSIDGAAFIGTFIEGSGFFNCWLAGDQGQAYPTILKMPLYDSPSINDIWQAKESGLDFFSKTYSFEEKNHWLSYAFEHTDLKIIADEFKNWILEQPCLTQPLAFGKNSFIGIHFHHQKTLSDAEVDILKRFSKVFDQAYIRFLDLQKAEAQAREAQIQLALERVRARTMAMQSSEELAEVSYLLNKQVVDLGIPTRGCAFNIYNEEDSTEWFSNLEGTIPTYKTPRENIFLKYYEAGQRGETLWIEEFGGDRIKEHYKYLATLSVSGNEEETIESNLVKVPEYQIDHVAYFKYGYLLFITLVPAPQAHDVFKRFAKEFEQTYTRFLDLQKAEAQARESQIQLALERVRARTMAMQHSSELSQTSALLFQQIQLLGVPPWSCGFNIWEQGDTVFTSYMGSPDGTILDGFKIPLTEEASFIHFQESRDRGDKLFVEVLEGKTLEEHYRYFLSLPGIKEAFEKRAQEGDQRPDFQIHHLANFSHGNLMFITYEPCPEAHDIFIRFAKIFEQTYIRFLDLQKAEVQAREAQIEAGLERVRSTSLAMHHSDELEKVVLAVSDRLSELGIKFDGSLIFIFDSDKQNITLWIATNQLSSPLKVHLPFDPEVKDNAIWKALWHSIDRGKHVINKTYSGKVKDDYFRYVQKYNIEKLPPAVRQLELELPNWSVSIASGKNAILAVDNWSDKSISEEEFQILIRFSKVFEQAYTRFLDLQKAEAQAREAKVEVALERIRARALAMQSSTELAEVAKVLRDQMGILGQEDLQASVVHLYSADLPTFDSWYAFRAGDQIIEGVATFNLENSALAKEFLKLYLDDITEYTIEVKGEKLKEWLAEIKRNAPKIAGYWGDLPPEKQFYHFSDFSGGALLMVSHENLTEETQMLQKRCASVFELAYKRFLDLEAKERQERELLEEKLRLEQALSELKATQSQLVQQEKLASLGQLTAGIAHEIKNPLNFVNNFSEVSLEMIEEVMEERSKSQDTRDETLVDEILEDIKSNLQKVHEHGTRANGIVTSMLQHSRGSSGKMAPTDLNALIKEYVNLSFHGMRANKNPIDVDIQLELGPSLEPVSLIKEDFTRVVINLCNNAFDAMRGKLDLADAKEYKAKLIVRTKLDNDRILIEVEDNGPGISDEIKDKILQPFFTTKKGTEGTGLGLSITHDIIKAHRGELEVETSINYGTKFIIKLNN